jgi:hypothetical protein
MYSNNNNNEKWKSRKKSSLFTTKINFKWGTS